MPIPNVALIMAKYTNCLPGAIVMSKTAHGANAIFCVSLLSTRIPPRYILPLVTVALDRTTLPAGSRNVHRGALGSL